MHRNSDIKIVAKYIKQESGINFTDDKLGIIETKLRTRLQKLKINNYEDYIKLLKNDKDEYISFFNKITTNYTFFMREKGQFEYLFNEIFPEIKTKYNSKKDLRIWSAGCATGEEAYTLAYLAKEYFSTDEKSKQWDTTVLATDISVKALTTAHEGIYQKDKCKDLSKDVVSKYLLEYDTNNYIVDKSIKENVIFRYFNLNQTQFNFSKKFHVIFCRNVMIYFDKEKRIETIKKFYDALEPGGYLFISNSEPMMNFSGSTFKSVFHSVYKKM